jgi:hypothetical protein
MANHRTPLALAVSSGRTMVNPARFADRAEPDQDAIDGSPVWLSPAEQSAFLDLVSRCHWSKRGDVPLLAMAAKLYARLIADDLPESSYPELRRFLQLLGMTPVDCSKVANGGAVKPKNRFT